MVAPPPDTHGEERGPLCVDFDHRDWDNVHDDQDEDLAELVEWVREMGPGDLQIQNGSEGGRLIIGRGGTEDGGEARGGRRE